MTKASTVGVLLVAVGSAFVLPTANDITSALAAAILQLLTLPIAASLIARATYLARGIPSRVDAVDEFADRHHVAGCRVTASPAPRTSYSSHLVGTVAVEVGDVAGEQPALGVAGR